MISKINKKYYFWKFRCERIGMPQVFTGCFFVLWIYNIYWLLTLDILEAIYLLILRFIWKKHSFGLLLVLKKILFGFYLPLKQLSYRFDFLDFSLFVGSWLWVVLWSLKLFFYRCCIIAWVLTWSFYQAI